MLLGVVFTGTQPWPGWVVGGSGRLSGTVVQLTDPNGLATFGDLRLDQPGAKRLRASSPQQAPANSNSFQVTSGAPSSIVVFSGSPQTAR